MLMEKMWEILYWIQLGIYLKIGQEIGLSGFWYLMRWHKYLILMVIIKNDEKLQDANYHLDKNTMEKELKGIGRVDKNGKFPFEKKLEVLDEFYEKNDDPDQLILLCLKTVQDNVSDFINCQKQQNLC